MPSAGKTLTFAVYRIMRACSNARMVKPSSEEDNHEAIDHNWTSNARRGAIKSEEKREPVSDIDTGVGG
jgi:hypothetical protein